VKRAISRRSRFVRAIGWSVAASTAVGSTVHYVFRAEATEGWRDVSAAVREYSNEGAAVQPIAEVTWHWPQRSGEPAAGERSRDLFTPPEGWRDTSTGRWRRGRAPIASDAVAPAVNGSIGEAASVQVVRIVRRSFPWQLVGFAESAGHLVGLFQEASSGAMVWRRSGTMLGETAFRIESIRVVLVPGIAQQAGEAPERVAQAVIVDSVAGQSHDLCTAERLGVGPPRAELHLTSTGRVHLLAAGETLSDGGATVLVTEIDPRRRRVVVRCLQTQTAVTADGVSLSWQRDEADETERTGQ